MTSFRHHLRVAKRIAGMSWRRALAYRVNFLLILLVSLTWLSVQITALLIILHLGGDHGLAGFSREEFFFVFLVSQVVFAFFYFFRGGLREGSRNIHFGELDFPLSRPLAPIFATFFQRIDWTAAPMLIAVPVLGWMVFSEGRLEISFLQLGQISFVTITSLLLALTLYLLAAILPLFLVNAQFAKNFVNELFDASTRWPASIFPQPLRAGLTYLLPVLLIAQPTFEVLSGEFSWLSAGRILVILVVFFLLLCAMWKKGLARYTSSG
jgi:ABC-2 type transport system permease protein